MAEGRARLEWAQTAALLALTANCHRDPKKGRPLTPDDFNPYARRDRRKRKPDVKVSVAALKGLFIRGK